MPRSIQEILEHADELAQRFEDYEPKEGDEVLVEEYMLRRAALARARCEGQTVEAVATARAKGITWSRIGEILGTSPQAAQQRYGPIVERAELFGAITDEIWEQAATGFGDPELASG